MLSRRINDRSCLTVVGQVLVQLQQLGEAEDRLQRVVQLVRHAGDEDADRGQPLLPDQLPLQRLLLLAHAALLGHLRRDRLLRRAQAGDHAGELWCS